MESLLAIDANQIVQIALFIVGLIIVWSILSAIMRMAFRLFTFGCGAILVLGAILLVLRLLGGQ